MMREVSNFAGKSFARRHSFLILAAGALDKEEGEGRGCFIVRLKQAPNSRNTHVSGGIDLSDSGGTSSMRERREAAPWRIRKVFS
jgi:hypothetical protein